MFSLLTDSSAWFSFLTLAVIEIVLGVDNLVFLAVMVARLPPEQQRLARQIGLVAAMFGRVVLLLSIVLLTGLNAPFAHAFGFSISGRTIILALGGFFLVHTSVSELYLLVARRASDAASRQVPKKFVAVLCQIFLLDLVFSLDSVFTAVGLVQYIPVMIAAIVVALLFMLFVARLATDFIEKNPSVKVLAFAFLLLVGVTLLCDAAEAPIPHAYLYVAMAFAAIVERVKSLLDRG